MRLATQAVDSWTSPPNWSRRGITCNCYRFQSKWRRTEASFCGDGSQTYVRAAQVDGYDEVVEVAVSKVRQVRFTQSGSFPFGPLCLATYTFLHLGLETLTVDNSCSDLSIITFANTSQRRRPGKDHQLFKGEEHSTKWPQPVRHQDPRELRSYQPPYSSSQLRPGQYWRR